MKIETNELAQSILKHKKPIEDKAKIKIGKDFYWIEIKDINPIKDKIDNHTKEINNLSDEFDKVSEFQFKIPFYKDIYAIIEGTWDLTEEDDWTDKTVIMDVHSDCSIDFKTDPKDKILNIFCEAMSDYDRWEDLCQIVLGKLHKSNDWKQYAKQIKSLIKKFVQLANKIGVTPNELHPYVIGD